MKMQDFIIGIILAGIVLTSFMLFFTYLNGKYPNASYVESDLLSNYTQQIADTQNLTDEINTQVQDLKKDSSFLSVLDSFFGGAYKAMKTSFASLSIFTTMTTLTFKTLGMPGYIVGGIITIVTILLLFVLIRAVIKVE